MITRPKPLNKSLRPRLTRIILILFTLMWSLQLLLISKLAHAAAPYLASDVLGQLDGSGNPVFTTGDPDNGSISPNAIGFDFPTDSTIDTVHHRLFVTDGNNSRVLVFNLDSNNNLIDHIADNVIGQPDLTTTDNSCYLSPPTQRSLCYPSATAYDSAHDRLFVSDGLNSRVMVFNTSTITNGMNADSELGEPDFISTSDSCNITNQNSFCNTSSLAYDPNTDRLFVVDFFNSRIMVFDATTITNEKNADNVIGAPDFNSNGCDTETGQDSFCDPIGLAYDSINHRLFVSDFEGSRVMVFNGNNIHDGMDADNVIGQPDFNSFGCNTDTGQDSLCATEGLGFDPVHNRLFVEDSGNNRIIVFGTSTITNGMNAAAVLGQSAFNTFDFGGCNNHLSQSSLCIQIPCLPAGDMAYDPTNNRLYVPDFSNDRVMIFDFVKLSNISDGTAGAAYLQLLGGGGQGSTTFTLTSGALPDGLLFDPTTGAILGLPTTAGTTNFSASVTDYNGPIGGFTDARQYSMTIAPAVAAGGTSTSGTTTTIPGGTTTITQTVPNTKVLIKPTIVTVPTSTAKIHQLCAVANRSSFPWIWLLAAGMSTLGLITTIIIEHLRKLRALAPTPATIQPSTYAPTSLPSLHSAAPAKSSPVSTAMPKAPPLVTPPAGPPTSAPTITTILPDSSKPPGGGALKPPAQHKP